jgi:hypothetical protein
MSLRGLQVPSHDFRGMDAEYPRAASVCAVLSTLQRSLMASAPHILE